MDFHSVLDVGSGGVHADILRDAGKDVTTINLYDADIVGNYLHYDFKVDCIWASHVLEHQPNPNLFLQKCFRDLNDDGILAITVPPLKHDIVGGHVTLWNAGILLYQLILAGFNCVKASVKTYDYNISVIVRKRPFDMPELKMDFGDIETLNPYFPMLAYNGFNGEIKELNW
jgi:SAM-dependent methyltransferase